MTIEILSINIGKPQKIMYRGKEVLTGIYKNPVEQPVFLSVVNFEGDGQGDLEHHGGVNKAICVYPYEHYAYWEKDLNRTLPVYGAFGENLTIRGLVEEDVRIGDIFELGEAVVQVSQPRQPCYKLDILYDVQDIVLRVQNTGYTGFYFRVLTEGIVDKKKPLRLIQKDPKGITVAYANQIMHHDKQNREAIRKILDVEALSDSWRMTFTKRLEDRE